MNLFFYSIKNFYKRTSGRRIKFQCKMIGWNIIDELLDFEDEKCGTHSDN